MPLRARKARAHQSGSTDPSARLVFDADV